MLKDIKATSSSSFFILDLFKAKLMGRLIKAKLMGRLKIKLFILSDLNLIAVGIV